MRAPRNATSLLGLVTLAALGLSDRAAQAQTYTVQYTLPAASATGTGGTTLTLGSSSGTTTITAGVGSASMISYGNIAIGTMAGAVSLSRTDTFLFTGGSLPASGVQVSLSDLASANFSGSSYTFNDSGGTTFGPSFSLNLFAPSITSVHGINGSQTAALSLTGTPAPEPSQVVAMSFGVLGLMGLTLKARRHKSVF